MSIVIFLVKTGTNENAVCCIEIIEKLICIVGDLYIQRSQSVCMGRS